MMGMLLHVQSCHCIQETELAMGIFNCEHSWCLSEQLNFHFHHNFSHMKQDYSSLRGDKECNDEIFLVKVLRKYPGNQ